MNDSFSTNKVLVEVEVMTQFGPRSAAELVKVRLGCPAVNSIKVLKVETNYRLHENPADSLRECDESEYKS